MAATNRRGKPKGEGPMTTALHDAPPASSAGELRLDGETSVRRMGYGTMQLPGLPVAWGPPRDRDAALHVLRRAHELGFQLIDTAGFYGPEVADQLIFEALYPYPADLVIASKVGVRRGVDRSWLPDAAPASLREQVEASLRRLRVDALDLVYLRLAVRDGRGDTVRCGTGRDKVTADKRDRLRGCERIRRVGSVSRGGRAGASRQPGSSAVGLRRRMARAHRTRGSPLEPTSVRAQS